MELELIQETLIALRHRLDSLQRQYFAEQNDTIASIIHRQLRRCERAIAHFEILAGEG